jgi:CelD/BcsL family acetyltransferase involved in cellulose biosynthesis
MGPVEHAGRIHPGYTHAIGLLDMVTDDQAELGSAATAVTSAALRPSTSTLRPHMPLEPPDIPLVDEPRRPATPSDLDVEVLTTLDACWRVADDWRALSEVAAPRNPFATPTWMLTWARHFAEPDCVRVVLVRDRGVLVGVAPLHLRSVRVGGISLGRRLELLAGSSDAALFERPQLIAAPGCQRRVLRLIIEALLDLRWDFASLSLQAGQGWIEPHWARGDVYVVPNNARASVILSLPESAADLERSMKRNLRESLRRARNRLRRAAPQWGVEVVDPADTEAALDDLLSLHRRRAQMPGKVVHPDLFADPRHEAFARDVLLRAAAEGALELSFLRVEGDRVGGIATLLAPQAVYFAFSGLEPKWWDFSIVTLLQFEAFKRAIGNGRRHADLSVGVDVAKLRWSEDIMLHPEFVLLRRRARSEAFAIPYLVGSAGARLIRERERHARRTR